jgi:hypothetical protein
MEVNERLEQEKPLEILAVPESQVDPRVEPHVESEVIAEGSGASIEMEEPAPAAPSWLRLAYCFEFLIAVIAVIMLWSQVGGQGHMDLLPWYTKLACIVSMSWFCVRFTGALVEQRKVWNRHAALWFSGILLMGLIMGGIVYYYHLHEVPDESDSEDSTAQVVSAPSWHDQTNR